MNNDQPDKTDAWNPHIHCMDIISSCMDEAYRLVKEKRFPIWDSVQANMQTAGRGQMRRKWVSLPGNLFAAIRLPENPPFNSSAAAIAIATLCASALRSMCCPVYIKWPNDLVSFKNDKVKKIGGILVEDRPEGIIAGIGINLVSAPSMEELDRGDVLTPGVLEGRSCNVILPDKWEFWRALVKHIYSIYKSGPAFNSIWKDLADELLLWRSLKVKVIDEGNVKYGQLIGIAPNGAALLRSSNGVEEIIHGLMYLEDDSK